jgi:hypothetical protein
VSDPFIIGPIGAPTRETSARSTGAVGAIEGQNNNGGSTVSREQRIAATMRLAADLAALPPIGDDATESSTTVGRQDPY